MKVIVALSGGIDSSVASYLLKQEGYEIIGLTFKFWNCNDDIGVCCGSDAVVQARNVAGKIGFPHYVISVEDQFNQNVLKNSWELFSQNRTPNPCAFCNQFVKFPTLFKYANELGADFVATGHYAISNNGLFRGKDTTKDQSYFLYSIVDLGKVKFPLGSYTKKEVREIAEKIGLSNAKRKESQDLCFNVDNFPEMLKYRFNGKDMCGNIVKNNKVIGQHSGTYNFTIGQRKGALGNYVIGIKDNDVLVGEKQCVTSKIEVSGINWLADFQEDVLVQTRYRQTAQPAKLEKNNDSVIVSFISPQYSIAPGQIAVFYSDNKVIGGGIINEVI